MHPVWAQPSWSDGKHRWKIPVFKGVDDDSAIRRFTADAQHSQTFPFISKWMEVWHIYVAIYLSIYLSIHLSTYPSIHPSICLSICLCLSVYLPIYPSVRPYTYLYQMVDAVPLPNM